MTKDTLPGIDSDKIVKNTGSIDLVGKEKNDSIFSPEVTDLSRRTMLKAVMGTMVGGAAAMLLSPGISRAADVVPNAAQGRNPYATKDNPYATKDNPRATQYNPYATGTDYSKIPQRLHKYPSSNKAKKIVHDSITIDTLFSGTWPEQWSTPEAPEFHDEMDRCIAGGMKIMAVCPSADALNTSSAVAMKALQFYLKKINERPDKYKIVRTTKDIDDAIKEKKLGLYFTHQGTGLFEGDVDNVAIWRQLGYGYCLLAYNQRNPVGDGCFVKENGGLTAYGKTLIDAYNHYGMLVDVSHTGERTSLDAIERSSQPVISSHAVAMAIANYPRSLYDSVIKAIAKSGGVCSINMVGAFVDTSNPDIVTTDMLFRHIDYMANLVGIDHVGFGSDYIPDITFTADGMKTPAGQEIFPDGGYTTKTAYKGFPTPSSYQILPALLDKMLSKGYTEEDCQKFIGGNMYRVMKQVWK
ncbi:membrane dipeptidase, M19 [Desulfosarcina variabilis str. Montpellier]|uniref:dipeptidase n=1 Tax=Desulfosarcina variabilis TaxID=2300 RepID=UPI003AFAA96F